MMVTNIELIKDFVNTLHKDPKLDGDEEELTSPDRLDAWLKAHGLATGARATTAGLARALELREALRVLLLANNGEVVDVAGAYATLDRIARGARVGLRFPDAGPVLVTDAEGVAGAFGQIVVAVQAAIAEGSWHRLKACRARDCEWAFIDNAKNQSRAWCSMSSCGNREKARAHRARHRTAGS
jgi:predicted RNA-binding Zn ribbon-like protein